MTATDTYLVLRAFCDELARCGMRHACTSPGSRNTPLVLSLVREPRIETFSHIDERCAGFFALGAAKASGLPVAVTCTSGTATANLTPAVIEAHEAHVPLLALTADRPPELRDVGAGQTIDQLKLYGDAVKWFFEVGVHDATDETLRWIRTLACRAYATALDGRPGPVHLNFPLREPLVLEQPLPSDDTGRAADRPYVIVEPRDVRAGGDGDGPHPSGRVVIVAGAGTHDPAALASYAARQRIPVLADPLSGARRGDAAIAHYDLLLRERTFTDEHRPDFVLRVGELPTSKPLRAWLATLADVPQIAFDPYGTWHDPASVTGMRIHSAPPQPDRLDVEPGWLKSWSAADAAASSAIDQTLGDELSEPLVARKLGEWLPTDATLFVASSMPVRDVEEFVGVRDDPPRFLSNRGANGIDGTVSSAFGAAAASDGPVVLLIGDVALAHDVGGLLAARRLPIPLTIVLLNNDGGGIFHFLPVASQQDAFEHHIATPHGLEFERAAALYGCAYERPATVGDLEASVARAIRASGTTIIEVQTNRERNLVLHQLIASNVVPSRSTTTGSSWPSTQTAPT
jgi:2-succinyl-5-enolpyruvyl-6-hydroxy-3-cyclohexene-1-carboxylate synthase